ncbi:DUF1211 domain-containing membrane protein [Planotetraspora silvatica]|uniref:DUF1211 domain-containing membrane protein n=1 Tax=Planotetraspora silvatica TaxID=234614 RepID=A0A8J3XMV3_9ACTN|nr:TMEM175 family protein [Planotetraspora silvatica]GII47857.1 DUF1211 domain-containing membrane protein [Planotetraspora silvatica]
MTDTESSDVTTAPGLTHERVGMFTDAVFAIAMTLLVIEIPRPERHSRGDGTDRMAMARELWHFLDENAGIFLAFFIAFMVLWATWRQHHRLFDQITRVSPGMLRIHIPLLILVVLLPYPTALIGESSLNPLSVTLFAGAEAGLLFCQAGLNLSVVRGGVARPGTDTHHLRVTAIMLFVVGVFWLITAALSWVADGVPYLWLLTPLIILGGNRAGRRFVTA